MSYTKLITLSIIIFILTNKSFINSYDVSKNCKLISKNIERFMGNSYQYINVL